MTVPRIDPDVRYLSISGLRSLNATVLENLKGAIVVINGNKPLAVIISFETFLEFQSLNEEYR